MPSVFVSYARDDLDVVQQLAQGLMERGVSVWRDQDSLYAGQKWPKAPTGSSSAPRFTTR